MGAGKAPGPGSLATIAAITDGTSNTIAFGEWKVGDGNNAIVSSSTDIVLLGSYPPAVSRNTPLMSLPTGAAPFQRWVRQCAANLANAGGRANHTSDMGMAWAIGIPSFSIGNVVLPPNPKTPDCSVTSRSSNTIFNPGAWGLTRDHSGGANVLIADGSVKFLEDSASPTVVWALGSRARGEIVSADSY